MAEEYLEAIAEEGKEAEQTKLVEVAEVA